MSDEPMQTDIFGGETPVSATAAPDGHTLALRAPGWYLVATNRQGPRTWHRLETGVMGTVITCCGIRGHVVPDAQREITLCPVCEAEA